MKERANRLVVASNRLPVVVEREGSRWRIVPGMGGLVTALGSVLGGRGGVWVGWPGESHPDALDALKHSTDAGYALCPVTLSREEVDGYYHGLSNEVLWPLFHDLLSHCNFDPAYWPIYCQVNEKFARAILRVAEPSDYIWIQDYHLILCASVLRKLGVTRLLGFFLHIPYPPLDIFLKLPWRFQILQGLLHYDLIGFQTMRDRRNFIQCARALLPSAKIENGNKAVATLTTANHKVRLGTFPIGVDFRAFEHEAGEQSTAQEAWYIHENLPKRQLVLGIDRLDYTKGIPERIRAMGNALERYPDLLRRITFVLVVVPSRVTVPEYQDLKAEIERLVSEVNGRFTCSGWTPIHYTARALTRTELLAYYRTCEIALVTPLKDGMNLVAKEYCAASIEGDGVLILSEFAGAAAQLQRHALLVNPYDIEGVADAIHRACLMPPEERRHRMVALRRTVRRQDVFWWVGNFLRAAIAQELDDFQGPLHHPIAPRVDSDGI